jgi:hypothetical protein
MTVVSFTLDYKDCNWKERRPLIQNVPVKSSIATSHHDSHVARGIGSGRCCGPCISMSLVPGWSAGQESDDRTRHQFGTCVRLCVQDSRRPRARTVLTFEYSTSTQIDHCAHRRTDRLLFRATGEVNLGSSNLYHVTWGRSPRIVGREIPNCRSREIVPT